MNTLLNASHLLQHQWTKRIYGPKQNRTSTSRNVSNFVTCNKQQPFIFYLLHVATQSTYNSDQPIDSSSTNRNLSTYNCIETGKTQVTPAVSKSPSHMQHERTELRAPPVSKPPCETQHARTFPRGKLRGELLLTYSTRPSICCSISHLLLVFCDASRFSCSILAGAALSVQWPVDILGVPAERCKLDVRASKQLSTLYV